MTRKNIQNIITIIIIMVMIMVSVSKTTIAQKFNTNYRINISGFNSIVVKSPNLEFIENNVDLKVKVLGGEVKLNRTWVNGRWYVNPAWSNLRFILDPLDNSIKTIDRAGTMYQRIEDSGELFSYEQVSIKKNTNGWHWFDLKGNWINYDNEGRILEYGDANNVKVSFVLDDEGRRIAINDHFGELVYRFTYNEQEYLIKATDREGRTVNYEWSGNQLVKVIDVMGNTWLYGYDNNGQLNQKTAPDGSKIKIDYTVSTLAPKTAMTSGKEGAKVSQNAVVTTGSTNRDTKLAQVGKIIDNNGAVTIYNRQYNRANKQFTIIVEEPLGKKTVTVFDNKGKLITKTVNDNLIETYQRDRANHLIKYIDRRGFITTTQYNQFNKPVKTTYADGTTVLYEYNKTNELIKLTNAKGIISTYEYDASHNLIKLIEAVGKPEQRIFDWQYDNYGQQISSTISNKDQTLKFKSTFDKYGNISSFTNAKGAQYQYAYNIQGQVTEIKNPFQQTFLFNYNLSGYPIAFIDPLKHSHHFTIDSIGRLINITDALGNQANYSYSINETGLEIRVTNALNQVTIYQYDNAEQLIKITSPTGLEINKTYNTEGKLIQEIDKAGNIITYEYGANGTSLAGLLAKIVYPTFSETYKYNYFGDITEINQLLDANTTITNQLIYDQKGYLTNIIDPENRVLQTNYNAFGDVINESDALDGQTIYNRDLFGNINKVTDANNNQYHFEYDDNNNLIRETKALGSEVEYIYNEIDQLIEQKNTNGTRITYQYDGTGNNIKKSYFDKAQLIPSQEIHYTYNSADQLIEVLQTGDANTHFIYQRDALGRVIQETISYGYGINKITKTLKYSYDEEGNLVSFSYPDNSSVKYQYDKNQLTLAILANGERITWSNYQWLVPTKINYPNAIQINSYDPLRRPLQIDLKNNDKILLHRQYKYDKVGNILRIQTENGEINYQYDLLNRLTLSKPSSEIQNLGITIESYDYDAIGNRISSAQQPGEWIYNKYNQLTILGKGTDQTTLTYTANSQLASEVTSNRELSYHYNVADRLVSIKDGNNEVASYQYDAFGRRISKSVNGEVTYFIYANEGLIGELDDKGNLSVAYGWVPNSQWGTKPLWQAKVNINQTLQSASYHYIITDHLGTPQLAINGQGQPIWKMHSDSFGNTVLDPDNQMTLNLRFPGQYYDQETGLSYNYQRDYNPKIGRYIQSDPLGLNGGINSFVYVENNPLKYMDANGQFAFLLAIPAAEFLSVATAAIITTTEAAVLACSRSPACILAVAGGAEYVLDSLMNPDLNSTLNNELMAEQTTEEGTNDDKSENCEEEVIPVLDDPTCKEGGELWKAYKDLKADSASKSCNEPGLSIHELTERIKIKQNYYRARKEHHDYCYQGGDKGHRMQIEQLASEIKGCYMKRAALDVSLWQNVWYKNNLPELVWFLWMR